MFTAKILYIFLLPILLLTNWFINENWREISLLHCCYSVAVLLDSLQPHGLQHIRFPGTSLSPRAWSNSCPLSQWCDLIISSSAAHFFSLQFSHQGLFQWVSSLHHIVEVLVQLRYQSGSIYFRIDWFDLFTVQGTQESYPAPQLRHQFFSTQTSLWSNSHIHTWPWDFWLYGTLSAMGHLRFLIHCLGFS